MKTFFLVLLALIPALGFPAPFVSFSFDYHDGVEGNTFTSVPFGLFPQDRRSFRYQQVYPGTGFFTQPALLKSMHLRVDAVEGRAFRDTFENIQLNFSTTSRSENSLSAVFEENVGADDTIVVGPGSLTLQSSFFHMTVPQPWDVHIEFAMPFYYNPRLGNLLMDIRIFEGSERELPSETLYFDAFDVPDDGVGRAWSDSIGNTTADHIDTVGLATILVFEPVPEPTSTAFFMVGLIGLGFICWRRKRAEPQL